MIKCFGVMRMEVLAYLTDKNIIYKASGENHRLKIGEVLIYISNQTECGLLSNYEMNDSIIEKTNRFLSFYVGFAKYRNKEVLRDFSTYVSEKENKKFRYHIPPFIFQSPAKKIFIIRNLSELIDLEIYNILTNQVIIKPCNNCGRYFIADRKNQTYCDTPNENGGTCKSIGANNTYIQTIKNKPLGEEYLRAKGRLNNQFAYGSLLDEFDYRTRLFDLDEMFEKYQDDPTDENKYALLALCGETRIRLKKMKGFIAVKALVAIVVIGTLIWLIKQILNFFGISF